ncbi:hypothetical protein [Streptomyces sp. NPDC055105]
MSRTYLTRRQRLTLARAALGGLMSGTARAVVAWLLGHLAS